jgi:hypothetical protein
VLISNQVNIWREIQADGVGLIDDDTLEGTERLLRAWIEMPTSEREAMAARTYPAFLRRYTLRSGAEVINTTFFPSRESDTAAELSPVV